MSAISLSSLVSQSLPPTPASTSAESTFLQKYYKERQPDVLQLNEALKSGNLSAAEQAYNNLVALGNNVLHNGNPFLRSDRALDFNAIGGALQNGDLAGAQKAFAALESTFKQPPSANLTPAPVSANLSSADGVEPNLVNLIA
jgi:hypothetical protein